MRLTFGQKRVIYNALSDFLETMPDGLVRYTGTIIKTDIDVAEHCANQLGCRVPPSTVSRIRREEFGELRNAPVVREMASVSSDHAVLLNRMGSAEHWIEQLLKWASDPAIQPRPFKTEAENKTAGA